MDGIFQYIASVFLFVCAFFLSEGMFQIQSSGAELEPAQDLPAWPRAPKSIATNIRQFKTKFIFIYLSGWARSL